MALVSRSMASRPARARKSVGTTPMPSMDSVICSPGVVLQRRLECRVKTTG